MTFQSELIIDTGERVKVLIPSSVKVYHLSHDNVNFFIQKAGHNEWSSTEITSGRSLIALRKTKKQSITDTKMFIDHTKDIKGIINKIVSNQLVDRIVIGDELINHTRKNGV